MQKANDIYGTQNLASLVLLQIANGISGYKAEVPRILMVSSAAVERNAIIGDDGGLCPSHTQLHTSSLQDAYLLQIWICALTP